MLKSKRTCQRSGNMYTRKRLTREECGLGKRNLEEVLDFVGSSYSNILGVSYRPVTKQEAYDAYLDAGKRIIFSDERDIDNSTMSISLSKSEYHNLGFDRRTHSFLDLYNDVAEQIRSVCGPKTRIFLSVCI